MARYIIFGPIGAREFLHIMDEDVEGGILAAIEDGWISYLPRTYLDTHPHVFV